MQRNSTVNTKRILTILFNFLCIFLFSTQSYCGEKGGIKVIAVITGDENSGKFKQPSGLFFDETKKRLYIADSGNKRLVSFDSQFKFLAELSHESLMLPVSFVRNNEGQFFILDSGKGEIIFIDVEKKIIKSLPLTGLPQAKEQYIPGRLALGPDNRIYIIDKLNGRILVVEQSGVFVNEIDVKDKGFSGFSDVKIDDNGDIYALDSISGVVYIFDDKGVIVSKFGGKKNNKNIFLFPSSLAVDKNGLIYVADKHAGKIMVFDKKGGFQYAISRPGIKEGELSSPSYIFVDREGKIYTIDGDRIQIFQEDK